jgi:hypothetical protein
MATRYSPKIISDGLVLHLDGENPKSYNGSGTAWYDLSKNGNGAMANTPVFAPSMPKSFSFSGANNTRFTLSDNIAFKSMTGDMTLCGWCRQDNRNLGNTPHQTVLCTDSTYRGGIKLMSDYWGNVAVWLANSNGTSDSMVSATSITNLGWKYICATRNSTTGLLSLYIDGVLVGSTTTFTGAISTSQIAQVGSEYHSSGYYYYGRIAMVSGYNRVLSAKEILQNYNSTKERFRKYNMISSNLQFFVDAWSASSYNFTGNTWTNIGSNGVNGTLTNGPTFSGDGGGCFSFDGVDDNVLLGSTITLGNSDWTVNILAKASALGDSFGYMLSNNSGGPVTNAFGINSSGKIVYNNYDGTWQYRTGNTTLSTNTWYYLTWVNKSDNTVTMYVNGVVDSSALGSYTTNGGPINSIGRNWYGYYTGKIASVSYYNTAHTAEDVAQNFKWARERVGL